MHDLPTDWSTLCVLVFLLGMRHGFDADHLAAIDGLTRLNQRPGLALARYCGALFSAGHGLVVLVIAVVVSPRPTMRTRPDTSWLTETCVKPISRAISAAAISWRGCA